MFKNYLIATAISAVLVLAPTIVQAGTQEDISQCRTALAAEKTLNVGEYRLRFKSSKGGSKRVMALEAIPNDGGPRYMVRCTVKRGKVLEVTLMDTVEK